MRKMTKFLSLVIGIFALTSCSSDAPLSPEIPEQSPSEITNPMKISPQEAAQYAENLVNEISTEKTRSPRTLKSIMLLRSEKTRAGGKEIPDSMLYLINYADGEGFALVAADRRIRPFYAVSDEGNLDLADTVENKGLAMVMDGIYADAKSGLFPWDSIMINPGGSWGVGGGLPPDVPIHKEEQDVNIPPMLKLDVRRWGQRNPFNRFCFTKEGQYAAVGCAAIAIGQIMSFFEHPKAAYNVTYNWNAMKTGQGNTDLYHLLADLGRPENLNMIYAFLSGSSQIQLYASRTFRNFGYESPGGFVSCSNTAPLEYLREGYPVLIIGFGEKIGHAWVLDGAIGYTVTGQYIENRVKYSRYYHCVWGQYGNNNGYYWIDNSVSGNAYDVTDGDEPGATIGSEGYSKLEIMGKFKHRK